MLLVMELLLDESIALLQRSNRKAGSEENFAVAFRNCSSANRGLSQSFVEEGTMTKQLWRILSCVCRTVTLLGTGLPVLALFASESPSDFRRFTFNAAIQGSASSGAQVNRLEASVGYNFSRQLGIDSGLPFYFVNSNLSTDPNLNGFRSGLGNAFITLRATPTLSDWNYVSSLTATAPTGDRDRGFSTGRVTLDWNNFISRPFSRFTPFANLGIANTVSDTAFFYRPFSSLGIVGHFEGGTNYRLHRLLSVGASVYGIVPSGDQKIYSRVIKRQNTVLSQPSNNTNATGRGKERAFETTAVIVDDTNLARDHGFSGWLTIYPTSTVYLQTGYHRSVPYAWNSFFFGVGVQLDSVYGRIVRP